MENSWKYSNQISFKDESEKSGSINPGDIKEIVLLFSPNEIMLYESDISFTTQVTNRVLRLSGQGIFILSF